MSCQKVDNQPISDWFRSLVLFILFFSFSTAEVVDKRSTYLKDESPYCGELVEVIDVCDSTFSDDCLKTCTYKDRSKPKTCGVTMYDAVPTHFDAPEKNSTNATIHHRIRRIVGGNTAKKGEFPWQVGLYYKGGLKCGGAVLTPNWIITAAHCFDKETTSFNERDWLVTAGDHSLLIPNEKNEQVRYVKKLIIHEGNHRYRNKGHPGYFDDFDVALLKLDASLNMGKYISPVCLPSFNLKFDSSSLCKVSGWGSVSASNNANSNVLRQATMRLIPRDVCNLPISYNGKVHTRAICAGYQSGHTDVCTYDSGGALACKQGNNWFAVGLVSWGYHCGKANRYGIYAYLPRMEEWLIKTILQFNDNTNSLHSSMFGLTSEKENSTSEVKTEEIIKEMV